MQKYEFESSQKIENCPQCGSAQLDQNNPFGKIECKNCLWLADASQFRPKSRRDLVRMSRLLFFGVLLFFTLAFGVQLSRWQRFSVDVSWFYLKRMVGQDGIEDWMNMGAICNSLKKFECSVSAFSAVLQKQARQRPALANLAMALGHLGQWREAQPYFEAYFSLGGEAYDTMFWYARALTALGEKERGIEWYFKSLKQNPQFMEAAKELVDGLVVEQRSEEALSLIAH
ncbi:MAG: hypothetical protein KDD35_01800, partial [Bdellovibrionales bacterium]|nr:hypothetical protein [Bdellovibrionales bacterium]